MHLPGQFLPADLLTSVSRVGVAPSSPPKWKAIVAMLLVVCLSMLLKGQARASEPEEGSVWLLGLVVAIVLCWEGLRAACATCVRCLRPRPQAPTVLHTDMAVQTERPLPPRISANLEAHFSATGERWHQQADCPDIRHRVTRRYLPCGRCTAHQEMVVPPDVPQPIPVHNPPAPPVRRRNRP